MLDLQKLIGQINELSEASIPESEIEKQILSMAQSCFEEAKASPQRFEELIKENGGSTFWPLAIPLESIGEFRKLNPIEKAHSVVASDGSQIMPTQHELSSCFLLNIGSALIHYGENSQASLSSSPFLFHSYDDLYPLLNKRRIHIDASLISFKRNLKELEEARKLAESEKQKGRLVLTLVDGSLIPFNLDRNLDHMHQELLLSYSMELDAFNAAALPLIGYISHSRSAECLNALRIWLCPYNRSHCQIYCGELNEENFPCSKIWPLSDRQLMKSKLEKYTLSSFFLSSSHFSLALPELNRVCFAYLNTGEEAARIEIPQWLFRDKHLLDFSLQALLSQIQKGQGYPISLSEAHNMAIVRASDRNIFFKLIAETLMRKRQKQLSISPKESKKRRGIV